LVYILAQANHTLSFTNEPYTSLGTTYILEKVNQLRYYTMITRFSKVYKGKLGTKEW